MAAVDVQWPSEDEDFDAVTTNEPQRKRSGRRVSVNDEAKEEPDAPQDDAAEAVDEDVSEDEAVQDTASDEKTDTEPTDESTEAPESTDSDEAAQEEAPEPEAAPAAPEESDDMDEVEEAFKEPEEQPKDAPKPARPNTVFTPDSFDTHNELPHEEVTPLIKAPRKGSAKTKHVARFAVEAVLVVAVAALGLYAWNLSSDRDNLQKQVSQLNENPQVAVQKQTDDLIKKVGALMQLPSGEAPTVANVSDASKAKEQSAFFANAQNGDKVLMYVKAGEAILYRPSTDKIVLVAPLTFTDSAATGAAAATTKTGTAGTTATGTTGTTTTNKTTTTGR